ncbi:MAG: extracellular solute-binding protein [Spirochaetales bacterium]|jgi:iron(III) transport system substrate-binding protein|nr:extracellular solute-binding protein [Spirochaetales bacterium]
MKRFLVLVLVACCVAPLFAGGAKEDNRVVIYTSTEDFRTEHIQQLLKEKFPAYDIVVQVLSTGNHAAKIKAEGTSTEADIILNLETGYLESVKDVLADLSSFDTSEFLPELIPADYKYLPWDKSSGVIAVDRRKLDSLGIPVPANYDDLIKPAYKGLLSMPSPKSSATGYMFLVSLINLRGEDAAFSYFDKFAENVLQFTSSGSGPVNALLQGEAAIGLGMTITATDAINNRKAAFEMIYFKEGAPYNTSGMGIIKGRETRPVVREVFNFIIDKVVRDDKELYCPEAIFRDSVNNIPNYPKDIPYADMTGGTDLAQKERLLAKWKY